MMNFSCSYEIIDAHIHPFISKENSIAPFGHPETLEEFTAELKKIGTNRACGSVLILKKDCSWADIRKANDLVLEISARYPGFYIPGIHIHGKYVAESEQELRCMAAQGVRWIGELVPYIMGTENLNSSGNMEILATASELGMTVNLHWGTADEVIKVAKSFPDLNIVLAHPGDLGEAVSRIDFIEKLPNVHLDFSGTGLFRWNLLRYTVDRLGADRVLYGSDFPVCSPGLNLYGALCENLTETEFEKFFSGNFKRLTGL